MSNERRSQPGVAIVTTRGDVLKARTQAARLPARVLVVQPGPSWPEHRAPLVLDTIGLELKVLIALLAAPPRLPSPARPSRPGSGSRVKPRTAPLIAFADPANWRTLRLLALCPAVRLICPDDPVLLRRWLAPLACARWNRAGVPPIVWLLDPPPELHLDPLLLPILAVLPSAPSLRAVAERCGVSASTLARVLRGTRAALGLPPGDVARFQPAELAATILERLGADAPICQRLV